MPTISKSELFRNLGAAGYDPSDDHLEELRPDLLTKFVTIDGRGNERFATDEQQRRIWLYYGLRRRIGVAKVRKTEVAFWFAALGFEVPPGMVAEHIEWSVQSFVGALYRTIDRRGSASIPLEHATIPQTAHLGDLMAKAFLKVLGLAPKGLMRQVFGALLRIGFQAMFRQDGFSRVSIVVNGILRAIGVPDPSRWARPFWEGATEVASFFVKGDRNALVAAVRDAHKDDPSSATRAARDAAMVTVIGSRVFPWLVDASSAVLEFERFTERDAAVVNRLLIPMIAAVLLFLRDREFTQQLLEECRNGNYEKMADLATICELIPVIRERLGAA